MDEKQKYRLARKRVEAKIGFYIHAGVFVAVNLLLEERPAVDVGMEIPPMISKEERIERAKKMLVK